MSEVDSAPAVTVLMPVYNGARYMREQVSSILAQQGVTPRLVILDDGSSDDSYALINELAANDPRILVAERRPHAGLLASVRRLLAYVDTPYFAMSDQDDVWDRDKLRRSIDALNQSGVKLVYSDVRIINEFGNIIEGSYWTSRAIYPIRGQNLLPIVFQNPVIGHTVVASAEVAKAVTEMPSNLIYYEVWLAAAAVRIGTIDFVSAQLGSYRVHSSNVVGPLSKRLHRRILQRLTNPRRLNVRQQQRGAALSAISDISVDYQLLADLYEEGVIKRVRNLPLLLCAFARCRGALGIGVILKESVLHVLFGAGKSWSNAG